MKKLGIVVHPQHQIPRNGRHRGRNYYVDFAVPDIMLAIECDGKAWHTGRYAAQHKRRQAEIESLGWEFIRFTGSEICIDPESCARQILQYIRRKQS